MEDLTTFLQKEIESLTFSKVGPDESLIKSKLLDSITLVDLAVAIEEKTGIHISNTDIKEENFDTINKISAFVGSKIN